MDDYSVRRDAPYVYYVYNAQGQRVKKTVSDGASTVTTLYHYDQGGQLIAETDGQGNLLKEYLYLDGMRIATVDNDAIYYVHTDHLGAPLALTDSSGTVQWKGSYDPYGNVTIEINNLDQSQRFPGQRLSEETGLYYNYFRDYDPEIGRYIQSDPIGLNGGINTYGYVGGNPVMNIDRYGLAITGFMPAVDVRNNRVVAPNPGVPYQNLAIGAGTYVRGWYRNGVYLSRKAGLFGQCEKLLTELEDELFKNFLNQYENNEKFRNHVNGIIGDKFSKEPSTVVGRLLANLVVSRYLVKGKGNFAQQTSVSIVLGSGAAVGDARNFIETSLKKGGKTLNVDGLIDQMITGSADISGIDNVEELCGCLLDE